MITGKFTIRLFKLQGLNYRDKRMAEKTLKPEFLSEMLWSAPHLAKFPTKRFWVDYDEEADVLYLSFERPQNATESKMLDNGILLRYREEELVGVTILDVSKR